MALVRYISALGLVIMLLYKMNNRKGQLASATPITKKLPSRFFSANPLRSIRMRVGSLLNWFHISVTCPKSLQKLRTQRILGGLLNETIYKGRPNKMSKTTTFNSLKESKLVNQYSAGKSDQPTLFSLVTKKYQ